MRRLGLPNRPWIVGHRGAAGEVLENTLESVSRAVEAGVDMVEVDLRQTADGNLVVFHDANLDRLTGRDLEIETVRWAEISGLEIVAPERAAGRIPLLCDLLDAAPRELPLDLEVKIDRASREGLAKRLLAELRGRERVLVSSFDWTFLALLRRLAPTLPLAPISREDRSGLVSAGRTLGAWSLHCHHRLARRTLLEARGRDSRPVVAYTVNEPRRARTLLRRGVRGIFTDLPTKMIRALDRWPA